MTQLLKRLEVLKGVDSKTYKQFIDFLKANFNEDDKAISIRLKYWDYQTYESFGRKFCNQKDYDFKWFARLA